MGKHQWHALTLSLLIAGCSSEPSFGNRQASQVRGDPDYGAPTLIRGKVFFGFEESAIVLCPKGRENCSAPVHEDGTDDMSRYCWLEFTNGAGADRDRLHKSSGQWEGAQEYWMEGTGRITQKPGAFGHLAQYGCEVEMINIRKFEVGPPWFFTPPPEPAENMR